MAISLEVKTTLVFCNNVTYLVFEDREACWASYDALENGGVKNIYVVSFNGFENAIKFGNWPYV